MIILININIVGKSTVNEELRFFLESQLNGRDERWEETERKRKERRVRKSQVRRRWRKRDERGIQQQHFFCASSPSSAASSLAASKYSLLASHRIGQHLSLSRPVFLSLSFSVSLSPLMVSLPEPQRIPANHGWLRQVFPSSAESTVRLPVSLPALRWFQHTPDPMDD
ncbi:hypothetical protein BDQ94DRAFT_29906 [Aspergillus welwitschiae]|uniref:Uncharacterized protein n=1 Tax=Aspergillus welwitschiae TaxID=1341132 RepID=A0A3F3Q380_9EURO|nr:hypothetical protein BDQ94DRAFT_29906 [Aspergillus welwitschiae]RDH33467.1 hypothetical protein BDQ94DRAFT_29906 [Aspergillus welwitschiae]